MSTYPLLSAVFLAVALVAFVVALLVRRRRGERPGAWIALIVAAAVVLVVLTAIFDNVMIAVGLMTYASDRISGIHIGAAPLEDFAYPLAAALLLPALWTLWGGDRVQHD